MKKTVYFLLAGAILLAIVTVPNFLMEHKIDTYRGKLLSVYRVESVDGPFFLDGHSGATLYLNDGGRIVLLGIDDALFEQKNIKLIGIGDYSLRCRGGPYHDDVLMQVANKDLPPPQISNINHLVSRYEEVEEYILAKVPLSSNGEGVLLASIERDAETYHYNCSRYLKQD